MDTQVVMAKLSATIFVEAERPEAATRIVTRKLAEIEAELAGVRLGLIDVQAIKAFTEGMDSHGDEDD